MSNTGICPCNLTEVHPASECVAPWETSTDIQQRDMAAILGALGLGDNALHRSPRGSACDQGADRGGRMSTFAARYDSRCTSCDHGIRAGDEVRWADDVVIHAECREVVDDLAVTREPCMSCFQVPATNGTCGCES